MAAIGIDHGTSTSAAMLRTGNAAVIPASGTEPRSTSGIVSRLLTRLTRTSVEPFALVCVRVCVDARARPYLVAVERAVADASDQDERLRDATKALRKLRLAWLAIGTRERSKATQRDVEALIEPVPTAAPSPHPADALIATLLVTSHEPLLVGDTAVTIEDARAKLEALGNVPPGQLIEAKLVVSPAPVSASDAPALFPDPPLLEVGQPRRDLRFCPCCGSPVPAGLGACVECACER